LLDIIFLAANGYRLSSEHILTDEVVEACSAVKSDSSEALWRGFRGRFPGLGRFDRPAA
jgi:hypothetical protein